jgi:hypothetical protein
LVAVKFNKELTMKKIDKAYELQKTDPHEFLRGCLMCVLEKHGSVRFDAADIFRLINEGYNVAVTALDGDVTTLAGDVVASARDQIVVYLQKDREKEGT